MLDGNTTEPITPDIAIARAFLAELAPGETNFSFQTFDDGQSKRTELVHVFHGSLDSHFPELARLSSRGAGIYATVNRTDMKGRKAENVIAVRAIFVDLDGTPLENAKRFDFLPSIAVQTSPKRYHLYWLVAGIQRDEFQPIQKRMINLIGSDKSVNDLSRVMRLPGFAHRKKEPFEVCFKTLRHGEPYSRDTFLSALDAAEFSHGVRLTVSNSSAHLPGGDERKSKLAKAALNVHAPPPYTINEVDRICSALRCIPAEERETWLAVGFALKSLTAHEWPEELCFKIFDGWSRTTTRDNFAEGSQQSQWNSFRPEGGVTAGTIFDLAKRHGWTARAPMRPWAEDILANIRRDPVALPVDIAAPGEAMGLPESRQAPERTAAIAAPLPDSEAQATFARLASLSSVEYDRVRKDEAERLNIRVGTLDDEVDRRRPEIAERGGSGRTLSLPTPEPWPTPVDGADLLDALCDAIANYVKMPEGAAVAVALWCVHSHAFDASFITPRLAITSPEKRCGKTTLLRVVAALVPKPLLAGNITAAAMFRTVEAARPTLLIDEADTFLSENEELRGILNSGHARDGQVIRLVGEDHEPRAFSTWCPTALASIGTIPGTIEDRSIVISMRRRRKDESVARFRADRVAHLQDHCRKVARWVVDNVQFFQAADPSIPDELHDRAADNWRSLLAIADRAGGVWSRKARQAALELSTGRAGEADTMRTLLLSDIRDLFHSRNGDRFKSEALAGLLAGMNDRPWPTFDRGRPITPAGIARMLKPFEIFPGTIRIGNETPKGYTLLALEDAFSRYLPPEAATPPQA